MSASSRYSRRPTSDPAFARNIAVHLRDLFALALGAMRDAAALAEARGLRAARLQAIKQWRAISAITTSAWRLTPRYVQRLFESEGMTLPELVLNQRPVHMHQMLSDLRFASWTVCAMAFDAGFGDVSYFNRRFRRRYGIRPSDVRALAPPGHEPGCGSDPFPLRWIAVNYGGSHVCPVAASTCASLMPDGVISIVPSTIGSVNRRGPMEPGLNTVIPRSTPMKGTCVWPHTTSAAPSAFAMRTTPVRNLEP